MIVDWLSAFDMVLAGGLGAAGTILVTSIARRKKSNGSNITQCALHSIFKEKLDDVEQRQNCFVHKDMCNQKHAELLRRIDDLREHIDDKHEALMQVLNRR